ARPLGSLAFFLLAAIALRAEAIGDGLPTSSLSLDEAVRRAGSGSVSVRAAEAMAEAAQKRVWAAASAWLPQISASASGAWLANPPKGMTVKAGELGTLPLWVPASTPTGPSYTGPLAYYPVTLPAADWSIVPDAKDSYFKGSITLSQPIFAWGKIDAGLELAKLEAEIAALGLSGACLDAERAVKRSYDAALLARDSAVILDELRDLSQASEGDAEGAFAAGTTTKAAVLQAKAQVADLDSRIADAQEGERSALTGLAILAGLGEGRIALSSALRDSLPPFDESRLLAAAMASSTDRGKARAQFSEAARKLDLERGSSILLPNLAAFASLDASGQTIPFSSSGWMDSTWTWDLSLGLQAQVNLFDGGASMAKTAAARAELSAARIGVEASEDSLRMAIRDAVATTRRSAASLASKAARAAWAAEALHSAKASLDAGMMGRPDYNAAAMQEAGARLDLLGARYSLSEAVADLERLVGGSLP
ncbi:MAG TPA: TolC family protein, partial [Rectinemataceae bacterium]|nr:TolC family protein [Rectinemataceae bacterium]